MNILVVSKRLGSANRINIGSRGLTALLFSLFAVIPATALYAGFEFGVRSAQDNPSELSVAMRLEIDRQQQEVTDAKRVAQNNLDALALNLGQMRAHVIRLDALGEHLTQIAGLDKGEFNFDAPPAQGGPVSSSGDQQSVSSLDFITQMDSLSLQLEDRTEQLSVLENMLMNRNLQAEVFPAGRPIKKGWVSSLFGMRTDPFTGKLEMHKGMDLAGKDGSDVVAVGSGVVTWSGKRYGYGNMVEINHGNGYVTRYGHHKENIVKVGDTVKRGQAIALMGSTGRSTGPHVHFEVLRNGKQVDPNTYIQTAAK